MQIKEEIPFLAYATCKSTNILARKWAVENPNQSAIVFATEQTEGKGQQGKSWKSEAGKGWYFSFYVPGLNMAIAQIQKITWASSLAISDFILELGIANKIKWPNDVYTKSGKIAGILIENQINSQTLKSAIIGIGINIAPMQIDHHKFGVACIAEHISDFYSTTKGKEHQYIKNIAFQILAHLRKSNSQLIYEINERLFGYNKSFNFTLNSSTFNAIVCEVNSNGSLVLQTKDEKIIANSGSLIWNNAN